LLPQVLDTRRTLLNAISFSIGRIFKNGIGIVVAHNYTDNLLTQPPHQLVTNLSVSDLPHIALVNMKTTYPICRTNEQLEQVFVALLRKILLIRLSSKCIDALAALSLILCRNLLNHVGPV
jgi:hypothetical protein